MFQRALIVDDSVPIHGLIKAQLGRDGLELHSAYSGESALSMAADILPDVVLLDVDLPGIDGFEVCRRLKANATTRAVPVIFVTADFCQADRAKGLALGAAEYVTKPFKPDELAAHVDASLESRRALGREARVDGLTGLWTQQHLERRIADEVSSALRAGRPAACVVLDVDGLQHINRRHGNLFGDRLLRSVGNILLSQCRAADVVSHVGGGQFAIFLAGQTRAGGARVAERLCGQIRQQLRFHDGKEIGLTCSFGVADCAVAGDGSLLERAERALARAKDNGGGCVSIARPPRRASPRAA